MTLRYAGSFFVLLRARTRPGTVSDPLVHVPIIIIRLLCRCAAVPAHEAYIASTAHPVLCTQFYAPTLALSCAGAILKNRPVCYGTSRLKIRVCAVTQYALFKTPTLKSNKR